MTKLIDQDYSKWLSEIKARVRSTQVKASLAANAILIEFYWELGKMIVEKQAKTAWGEKLLEQLSNDLRSEFPEMKGLSTRNLKYCKQFFLFYNNIIRQQSVAQLKNNSEVAINQELIVLTKELPWGHNILIISKSKDISESSFYIHQTIQNGWTRDVLALQIKSNLYQRQGKSINNFDKTLPEPMSKIAQQTLKDPYIFDFMTLDSAFREKDIENQLVNHITKFILELGKGFAFVGQQYHIEIEESDYYIDLLFYHTRLKCYVVIELKNTKFIPEYAGKMNFYLSAVDTLIKQDDDKPTIGILLCRDKKNIEAEFALRDINKPIGVSEYTLTEALPSNLQSSLPTIEEIENEMRKLE